MPLQKSGIIYGLSTETVLSFYFLILLNMEDFFDKKGNLKHCWEVHKHVMHKKHLPAVTYSTFRARVKDLHWDVYKAIHTPATVEKRDKDRRFKAKLHLIKFRIKHFFRRLFNL